MGPKKRAKRARRASVRQSLRFMIQETLQLTGGNTKNTRKESDFYPTPPEVTHALMEFLYEKNHINALDAVWECACGNGVMAKVINEYVMDVFSSDIEDRGFGVGGVDFLKPLDTAEYDWIITNPPFSKASEFITQALNQCDKVAMLFKSQYWHAKTRLDLFREHPPSYVLPLTWRPDFLNGARGNRPTMECLWTVWLPDHAYAKYIPLKKPTL